MKTKEKYKVLNMNCNHCVANISKALEQNDEIEKFKINLKKKEVIVTGDVSKETVIKCIEDAGYQVER